MLVGNEKGVKYLTVRIVDLQVSSTNFTNKLAAFSGHHSPIYVYIQMKAAMCMQIFRANFPVETNDVLIK